MAKEKVVIIGAGVSGLVCALELEKRGFAPLIIDEQNEVGGRLQTEQVEGFTLDRGFQVLLTSYPAVKNYLDLNKLNLQYFKPGAAVFKDNRFSVLGDPLRDSSFLFPTISFPHGNLMDKVKIWRLSKQLKGQSLEMIFQKPSQTTIEYLRKRGFSSRIIESFFKPFYTGIFLEEELATSSRMFEFVFKMFAEGYASLPTGGIQEVALQLKSKLSNTTFKLGQKVSSIGEERIVLSNGAELDFDKLVLASYRQNDNSEQQKWNACFNFYFETEDINLHPALIGLNANGKGYINNFSFILNDIGKSGISVTVVKEFEGSPEALAATIEEELWTIYGINTKRLIQYYQIPYALPKHETCTYEADEGSMVISSNKIVCGDALSNSSLNAAMLSGAKAASLI